MQLDLKEVEELSKTLYIRALKLLCQDTGIPIYNVTIGRHVESTARP